MSETQKSMRQQSYSVEKNAAILKAKDTANPFYRIISYAINMAALLQKLLRRDYPVPAIPTDDLWLECDSEHDIEVYEACFGALL